MPASTGALRQRLKEERPELDAALERSWDAARESWLSAVPPRAGSTNSCPHLQNVETHLERLAVAYQAFQGPPKAALLCPFEIYVLLCAVLMHDIGKAQDGPEDHGTRTARLVKNHYAALGIPTIQIAGVVSRVCGAHAAQGEDLSQRLAKLPTRAIDPYGEVRERCCAALLILADRMSTSYVRLTPDFMKEGDGQLAASRRQVSDVVADFEGGAIRVVLGDKLDDVEARKRALLPPSNEAQIDGSVLRCLRVAFEDCTTNADVLETLRPTLAAMGIPLRAWLVEHCEHLYSCRGRETHEPALSKQYLERLSLAMWTLGTRVFGQGTFSYETLADQMRESVIERARRGARRVNCVAQRPDDPQYPLLMLGRDEWRWNSSHCADTKGGSLLDIAKEAIGVLDDPRWVSEEPAVRGEDPAEARGLVNEVETPEGGPVQRSPAGVPTTEVDHGQEG